MWVNGGSELVLTIIGFLTHTMFLTILISQELASTFNRLLVILAISDNIHYICSICIACMKLNPEGAFFRSTYLPQFHSIFHMNSLYILLALVIERLLALSKIQKSSGTAKRYFIMLIKQSLLSFLSFLYLCFSQNLSCFYLSISHY